MIILAVILTLIVVIIGIGMYKTIHSNTILTSNPIKTSSFKYSLQIKPPSVVCSSRPQMNNIKLIATIPIEIKNQVKNYELSLDTGSNDLIVYDNAIQPSGIPYSICFIGGCVNTFKTFESKIGNINIGVGMIQNGTMTDWCENILGLLEPIPNKKSGLELINWNRFRNFSIDLRNSNDMNIQFNDTDIPHTIVPRVVQCQSCDECDNCTNCQSCINKMFPGDYYTVKVDSLILENGKESGPFYYIIDTGNVFDIIPKNLKLWLNYSGQKAMYKIGGKNLIKTNINNMYTEENYLLDRIGTVLNAGLIGLNSMKGLKWFFSSDHIGISE